MKKIQFFGFLFLFIIFSTLQVKAMDIELTDITGHTGPGPISEVYPETVLSINNASNDISQFFIEVCHSNEVLNNHTFNLDNSVIKDWEHKDIITTSSNESTCYKFDCWTTGPPITTGTSGQIAAITFYVKMNVETQILISETRYDMAGWSTKNATFTPYQMQNLPVANAGSDKVVFNSVRLDASKSYVLNDSISSRVWEIIDRAHPDIIINASGMNPVLKNLAPGFYNVNLVVTSSSGLKDTDTMLLGVAGVHDVNGDGKTGLEEAINALKIISDLVGHQ